MRKVDSLKVCVVIPAYNEAATIVDVIEQVKTEFKLASLQTTIVVVNDNSKDATAELAKKAGAVVISHIINSGAGSATATGLSYAEQRGFDIAATMDADGQHEAKDVVKGVNHMLKSHDDLLIGSRLIDSHGMSKVKILGNRGLSFITYFLFGIRTTDSQSGLRIFSKVALKRLTWKTSGYEFCSEMLWRAKQLNLSINEYPVKAVYTEYSKQKGQNNWNAVNIIKSLIHRRVVEMFE